MCPGMSLRMGWVRSVASRASCHLLMPFRLVYVRVGLLSKPNCHASLPIQTIGCFNTVSCSQAEAIPERDENHSTRRVRPAQPGSAVSPARKRWGSERSERGQSPVSP